MFDPVVASKKVKWIILVHSTMIYSKNLSPFIKNRIRIDDKIKENFNFEKKILNSEEFYNF